MNVYIYIYMNNANNTVRAIHAIRTVRIERNHKNNAKRQGESNKKPAQGGAEDLTLNPQP